MSRDYWTRVMIPSERQSCHGPCDQGRRACPCPESCEVPIDYNLRRTVWLAYAVVMLAILGAIFWPY